MSVHFSKLKQLGGLLTPNTAQRTSHIHMSVWVSEKVIRLTLRICSRRFPWKQSRFLGTPHFPTRSVQQWGSKQNQKCLFSSFSSSERFYSQERDHNEELGESNSLEISLSPEVQLDNTASQKRPQSSPYWKHLERCHSPSDVLDLTCLYSPTHRQVSNSLTQMWFSTKKMSDEQRRYELQLMFEHPELDKFLQRAMKSIQYMRNDDLTYSLLSMVNLGVPQRSRVVQTFLQACQEKLNDFDEKSLSILASCLEHMEDSPNVHALKEGMRLVVEVRLSGIKTVLALQTMMRLLGKDAPKDLKHKLEKKALSMTDQFSLPNAQHMIYSMAAMGFYSKPLLHVCSKKITENLHGIPFNKLYNLLHSCKELLYRDLDLLTGISEYVASTIDIWTKKQLILFLSVFEDLLFSPSALMEAYAGKVIENPGALTLKDLMCVVKVYSSFNYDLQHQRQQFLDSLSDALGSYLPKMSGLELLKAVYCLCLLNHFPSALLEQLLQIHVLEELETEKYLNSRERMFQMVDLCLRLDCPPLPQPLTVPRSVLGNPSPNNVSVDQRLSRALQSLLAGQRNTELQEMVVVENLYILDGVITKPLPNQSCETETNCAEERRPPAESSRRIAVVYVPHSSLCYGTSHPRGPLAVKIRHLKILGYTPVLVTEQNLQSVSEEERVAILTQLIFPENASDTQLTELKDCGQ